MLKVFLVEDEAVVREGIKKNINWTEIGLEFAGEAADGELAYPLILKIKPDIVITDVKMPFMDGLELSRLVKKEMPWIKIIILSGYDEFKYAKSAINIGVAEYLLKPLDRTKIVEAVVKVKNLIAQEAEQKTFFEMYRQEMQEKRQMERKKLFQLLVSRRYTACELLDFGKKIELELGAPAYGLLLFQLYDNEELIDKLDIANDSYAANFSAVESRIEGSFALKSDCILFNRELEGKAILIKGNNFQGVQQVATNCISELINLLKPHPGIRYFAAISSPVQRLTELHIAFEEVSRMFVCRYFMDKDQVLFPGKDKELLLSGALSQRLASSLLPEEPIHFRVRSVQEMSQNLQSFGMRNRDIKIVERFLRTGAKEDVEVFVDDYCSGIGKENLESELSRQYLIIYINFVVLYFVEEMGYNKESFTKRCQNLTQLSQALFDIDSIIGYIKDLLWITLDLRNFSASQKYDSLIQTAKAFIDANYMRGDISLQQVASQVNISPSYFSTIFSQETGSTFIEYLTAARMEKARELLMCSNLDTTQIADTIGYRDSHYFRYLFKKIQGITPKEFRTTKSQINSKPVKM